jgi:hypothetical protein
MGTVVVFEPPLLQELRSPVQRLGQYFLGLQEFNFVLRLGQHAQGFALNVRARRKSNSDGFPKPFPRFICHTCCNQWMMESD